MRPAFVIRIQSDASELARRLAGALDDPLRRRGARVHIETTTRGLPGTTVTVGVRDDEGRPRWLTPLPVPGEPESASRSVVSFLERWGFIPGANAPRRAA